MTSSSEKGSTSVRLSLSFVMTRAGLLLRLPSRTARSKAEGIHYTMVNGEVLLEKGTHTGSYPGRVLRNARYHGAYSDRG